MFTGIVDHTGSITSIQSTLTGLKFTIRTQFSDMKEGESISVDGVCLTVLNPKPNLFECDLSPETLALTIGRNYREQATLNIERALLQGDRMGGHYVTGHVDQTAKVSSLIQHGEFTEMRFEGINPSYANLLVKKGSVTVNGVSLTVNEVGTGHDGKPSFTVMLIPHTLERTNLKNQMVGDFVNLEFDWMTKIIVREVQNVLQNLKENTCKTNLPL